MAKLGKIDERKGIAYMHGTESDGFDWDARYTAPGRHGGVAWAALGYPLRWESWTYLDEDGVECESDEGEWFPDEDSDDILCRMVGDDHVYRLDKRDLVRIEDEDYCCECGQVGCPWG